MYDINLIRDQTRQAVRQVITASGIGEGSLFVLGCSTSEIAGGIMGKAIVPEIGEAVAEVVMTELAAVVADLAVQCCEHLNRALVVEADVAKRYKLEIVSAIPVPTAGGGTAAAAYARMNNPVLVLCVNADAGMDIGGTLIGMHLKRVAVPLRVEPRMIGAANVTAAKTRPMLIGGERAVYS